MINQREGVIFTDPFWREAKELWLRNKVASAPRAEQLRVISALLSRAEQRHQDAIILMGWYEAMHTLGTQRRAEHESQAMPEVVAARREKRLFNIAERAAESKIDCDKLEAFDRIVEMLDHSKVGEKLLGDCTRGDLLRAATKAQAAAGEWTLCAAFYRELASMVGAGTVREASNRGQIVALLTTTFRPEVMEAAQ